MRNHDLDAGVEARGGAAVADGSAAVGRKRRKRRTRRSWSVEEKIRIARESESLSSAETITAVAERHGIPLSRLSSWRTHLCRSQLVAASSAQANPDMGFAAVEVEAARPGLHCYADRNRQNERRQPQRLPLGHTRSHRKWPSVLEHRPVAALGLFTSIKLSSRWGCRPAYIILRSG